MTLVPGRAGRVLVFRSAYCVASEGRCLQASVMMGFGSLWSALQRFVPIGDWYEAHHARNTTLLMSTNHKPFSLARPVAWTKEVSQTPCLQAETPLLRALAVETLKVHVVQWEAFCRTYKRHFALARSTAYVSKDVAALLTFCATHVYGVPNTGALRAGPASKQFQVVLQVLCVHALASTLDVQADCGCLPERGGLCTGAAIFRATLQSCHASNYGLPGYGHSGNITEQVDRLLAAVQGQLLGLSDLVSSQQERAFLAGLLGQLEQGKASKDLADVLACMLSININIVYAAPEHDQLLVASHKGEPCLALCHWMVALCGGMCASYTMFPSVKLRPCRG